jgi:hypothetical protein
LQLGGGNWAAKQGKILAFAEGDTSGKYIPRELGFSRAADIAATRVNKDGLVEKYRENKAHYSNNFATVSGGGGWGHSGINTISTGQDGYDGTTNATFIRAETTLSKHQVTLGVAQSLPGEDFSITGVFTLSVYAKPNGYDHLILRSDITNINASFNIATGVVGTRGSKCISSSMTYAGNGFYRCQATFNHSGSVEFLAIGMMEQDDTTDFTGDTSKGYILQDAQLEMGLSATDLISTNGAPGKAGVLDNLPRIDYTSGSAQLLMEPSRTNELPHSEYFTSQAYWQLNSAGTRTDNVAVSPEGVKNAMSLKSVGSEYNILRSAPVSLDTSTEYVFSFYAKNVDATNAHYRVYNTDAPGDVVGSTSYISQLSTTEWKRIEVSFTTNATDTNYSVYFASGNLGGEILLWGAQLEKGGYATSYIPTYGASDTRVNDLVTDFDMTKLDLGTTCSVYWEGVIHEATDTYVRPVTTFASHSSQSTDNRFLLFGTSFSGSTYTLTSRFNSGGTTYGVDKTGLTIGDKVKCLTVIDGTSQKFYVNGSLAGSDTIPATAVFNSLDLSNVAADINYTVDDIRFYPTAIDQSEAEALTTI